MTATTDDQPERRPLEPGDYEPNSLRDDVSFLRPDGDLTRLVQVVNASQHLGIGLTLTVGGLVVSGQLISSDAFWQQTADAVAGSPATGVGELGTEVSRAMADFFKPDTVDEEGDAEADDDADEFEPHHIHLRDVTVVSGGQRSSLPRWRGRLVAVDGWAVGVPSRG